MQVIACFAEQSGVVMDLQAAEHWHRPVADRGHADASKKPRALAGAA
ncbi:hypothetical protein HP532_22600 [Pseudomonas sp. CrR25]|nr:hypothetical protein [Pseudomonas sp. CrR25]